MERYIKPVKCKDCRYFIPYEKPVEDFDGRCFVRECETDKEEYCSYSTNGELLRGNYEDDYEQTIETIKHYKNKACECIEGKCDKCTAMHEYRGKQFCQFDTVIYFIEWDNQYNNK